MKAFGKVGDYACQNQNDNHGHRRLASRKERSGHRIAYGIMEHSRIKSESDTQRTKTGDRRKFCVIDKV